MPQPQRNQFAEDDSDFESNSHANEDSTDSDSTDSDEDLVEIRAAIAPARDGATIQEVRQALEMAQNLLLNMRGKCRELLKRNTLLEATTAKGRRGKNLTAKDLALSAKEDTIRAHGRKYSMTHCLWINARIFPLRVPPNIELFGSERWLSPQSIEDGVKAELFKFIPEIDHELMGYKNFAPHFAKGVSGIRSEMVSDVKSCAGAIFRLKSEFFVRGYPRDTQPECRTLLVNPHGEYTKFAPVLFLHPERPNKDEFLETAKLVRVLKVALFGKSSLSATYAPAPKTKGKLWQLRNTTPGMIAAAAVVAIFVLSGDKDLYAKGEKSNILYQQYHNYYRQRLMTGGAWARDITNFFNNALFPETSSSHAALDVADTGTSYNSWEEELERAMEEGGEGPAFPFDTAIIAPQDIAQSSSAAYPPSASAAHPPSALVACPSASVALPASTPVTTPDTLPPVSATAPVILHSPTPIIGAQTHSISSAMQDLALADEAIAVGAIPPKPKPKPRRTKAKAVQDETGAEVRRSGRKK
ncbi:uncharacterized protein F5891DRAFT_1190207 [Suillus fuscotomentosus]|uniref:Uncharacterized protein n=1 Tax=Suillus fuscotomentosus TaxID=1912939 RepID=A0AAD4E5W2_9AGAM|nr:uncharacterized protein F5891DRAFT_1190207 [Suillus fuscotomentosus]KAG1899029.1 hypothetical protein F5891DRAFT_1190207 [Suillus fuscotomentosus]